MQRSPLKKWIGAVRTTLRSHLIRRNAGEKRCHGKKEKITCRDQCTGAGWGEEGIRRREELDGLASVPGSFFCGTVVPASQPPTRNAIIQYATWVEPWFCWF